MSKRMCVHQVKLLTADKITRLTTAAKELELQIGSAGIHLLDAEMATQWSAASRGGRGDLNNCVKLAHARMSGTCSLLPCVPVSVCDASDSI